MGSTTNEMIKLSGSDVGLIVGTKLKKENGIQNQNFATR